MTSFNELISLPNTTHIIEGEGRVFDYTRTHSPVQFTYRPDVDVGEWFVRTSLEYNRGEEVGVIAEPGPLTLAVKEGREILIHDLNLCTDQEVLDLIFEEVEVHQDTQFAFVTPNL